MYKNVVLFTSLPPLAPEQLIFAIVVFSTTISFFLGLFLYRLGFFGPFLLYLPQQKCQNKLFNCKLFGFCYYFAFWHVVFTCRVLCSHATAMPRSTRFCKMLHFERTYICRVYFLHFATIQIFTKPQRTHYACFFMQNDAKFVATSTHFSCISICQTARSPPCPRSHSLINIFVHKNLWKTPQKNIKNCSKKPLT